MIPTRIPVSLLYSAVARAWKLPQEHDLGHQKLHIVNSILIQQFQPLAGHTQKDHHQYGQNNFQYFHSMHTFYVFLNIVFWYFLIQTLPDFLPYRIFRMANSSARGVSE